MTEVHRCRICNCVNDPEIETMPGDYQRRVSFFADPVYEYAELCSNCYTPEDTETDEDVLDTLWYDQPEVLIDDRKPDNDNSE